MVLIIIIISYIYTMDVKTMDVKNAKFGFKPELGQIILSYNAVNMIFNWVSRNIDMEAMITDILNNPESPVSSVTDKTEKQKIMIIIKLLLSNEKAKTYYSYPSKDATIMSKAIYIILLTSKASLASIKDDFYGYEEFLRERVATEEITEGTYKRGVENCMFIGKYLEKLEEVDFHSNITGYYVNSKIDGEQILIIKYKNIRPCCRCCCQDCYNTDSSSDEEEDDCVYIIKTYEFNHIEQIIDYTGLWEDCDGETEFKTEEEARQEFEYASNVTRGFASVELIKIDPDTLTETCIESWKDNIMSDSSDEE
jgi:hypothetical protein